MGAGRLPGRAYQYHRLHVSGCESGGLGDGEPGENDNPVAFDDQYIKPKRYHDGFPKDIKILAVAQTDNGPYVEYTIDSVQNRTYPLWGDQSFWVSVKPGTKMDPKVREFIRFVLSQEGQELVQKDGKYLPLTAKVIAEERKKLD